LTTIDLASAPDTELLLSLDAVRDVEGWLSVDQANVLHERARRVPPGAKIVEIGSYRGRSAIVLARAADDRVPVVAIDPHGGDNRGPREVTGRPEEGEEDHRAFMANLRSAGVLDRVRHVRRTSRDALADVDGRIELLYVDGAHQYAPARDDIRDWGARVPVGGTMLVHDAWASVGVTLALLRLMAFSRNWRYIGRAGTLVEYRRERRSRLANLRDHALELPWFGRNVAVKVALVLRQEWLAVALGHTSRRWPY
jgi:predicted O-methyltransferase YrrM